TAYISGLVFEEVAFDMPENEWVHLAATVNKSSGTARVFVNGVQAATLDTCVNDHSSNYFDSRYGNMYIGGNNIELGYDPLFGYLDDLRIYNTELNQTAIETLITSSAAVMRFEFDEDDKATVFIDATQNGYVGTPTLITTNPNPVFDPHPGTKGQIGNTALFNGNGSIEVANAAANINFNQDFTIMSWLKTTSTNVNILTETDGDTTWEASEKSLILDSQGRLAFAGFNNGLITSNTAVNDDLWHHVAYTWNTATNTGRMFIDGKLVGSSGTYVANEPDSVQNVIKIGAAAHGNSSFVGQLDELAVYQRDLTQDEMRGVYLRELIWYRDTSTAVVSIDADNPIVKFLSGDYHDNMPIDLMFSAIDPTSTIQQVQFGLKAPSANDYTWTLLERCTNPADLYASAIYCSEIDPRALDGEGRYQLKLRAYDAVGNMTELSKEIYVDGTAPTVSTNYNNQWVEATDATNEQSIWTIAINGTAADPTLNGGFPSSGLLVGPQAVAVTLYNGKGNPAGDGTQTTTLNPDGSWAIDYRFSGKTPHGRFTVEAIVQDQ
ncbi:MAG: LamG domain-containing protein, partial [Anaerolineales bacterium]|nr:LamG domain-containing protein [Anaerolineales bacterium]